MNAMSVLFFDLAELNVQVQPGVSGVSFHYTGDDTEVST